MSLWIERDGSVVQDLGARALPCLLLDTQPGLISMLVLELRPLLRVEYMSIWYNAVFQMREHRTGWLMLVLGVKLWSTHKVL